MVYHHHAIIFGGTHLIKQTCKNLNEVSLFTNEMSCIYIMNHLHSRWICNYAGYVTMLIRSPMHICVGLHDCVHA